ncbi:hypothetical protein [Pseudomonas floridensis]|uniref:hypothetical protein n=1 Tax=Pseudomonas floridensis TaxID=1958950 RepID=UPI001FCA39AF|nr:hypothetical protein [Pseudomonas floridensis]
MKLKNYISSLSATALETYALRCRISVSYLRIHVRYATKDPSVSLIKALFRESDGCVSLAEVLEHYGVTESLPDGRERKRRPKGRPVPPNTHHHSAVGTR